jgi:hypothetical protein
MKVHDVRKVTGRGLVVDLDAEGTPKGALRVGTLLHQGERAWRIVSVVCASRVIPNPWRLSVVVRGVDHEFSPQKTELTL